MSKGLLEAQLEVAKVRCNEVGYRPTKNHLELLIRAGEEFLQSLHVKEAETPTGMKFSEPRPAFEVETHDCGFSHPPNRPCNTT